MLIDRDIDQEGPALQKGLLARPRPSMRSNRRPRSSSDVDMLISRGNDQESYKEICCTTKQYIISAIVFVYSCSTIKKSYSLGV
jgi:hypothetical protein